MDKWPEIFNDLIKSARLNIPGNDGEIISDVKIENPQSHLYPDPEIPKPEVKI
jgi:hypothetical protein